MTVERDADRIAYRSRRHGDEQVTHRIVVRPTIGAPDGDDHLTAWLTGRWRAWTRIAGRFAAIPADHSPWPLTGGDVVELDESVTASAGLPDRVGVPMVHFSPGVAVRLGWPQILR